MIPKAPFLAILALLAAVLGGCDGGAATSPAANPDPKAQEGPAGPAAGGEKPADFAGDPDRPASDPDVIETKIKVGGMVITRKRPRYQEPDKKIRVIKDPGDSGINFPYRKRGEKGEHLNRSGKVVKDKDGKPIKMN